MQITESAIDGVLVLEPVGPIDSSNANEFTKQLLEVVQGRKCSLILDLQRVKYVSSAGLRSLLIVAEELESLQKKLALCGLDAEVRRIFGITRLDELFSIFLSRSEAATAAK
jgi:anti-anti-sigma factor